MDPTSAIFGIAEGVASLLKVGQTVYGWIQGFRHATESLRELQILVVEFNRLLEILQRYLNNETISIRIPPEETNIIIADARNTLQQLEAAIQAVRRDDGNDARQIQWVLNEARCLSLQQKLRQHRDSFQGILIMVQSVQMESHRRLSETTLRLLREIHAMANGSRGMLLQCSTEIVESMEGEAQVIITREPDLEVISPHEAMTSKNYYHSDDPRQTQALVDPITSEMVETSGINGDILVGASTIALASRDCFDGSCKDGCSCNCHTASVYLPPHLDPVRNANSGFATQFAHRCSIRECRRRRATSIGSLFLTPKKLKRVIGISLMARGRHTLIPLRSIITVEEAADSMICSTTSNLEGLVKLLQSRRASISERTPDHWTLLHNAAYYGTPDLVRFLIKSGADLDATEIGTRKPAHLAIIRAYNIDASQLDFERVAAFPDWRDYKADFEFTPIHIAVLEDYDFDDEERPSLSELLDFVNLANNAAIGQNWVSWKQTYQARSPLFGRIIEMYRQESNSLRRCNLEDKPFLNLIDEPSNVMEDWTPFHWATHTGRLDKMKTLLSNLANPFLPTRMKRNALHQAAEAKSLEVMNYVLQIPEHPLQGWFDIDLQDEWGETALHVAVYGKSADSVRCVEMLLAKGARRDLPRKGDLAVPLHLASWAKEDVKSAIVDLLSSDKGSHINARDRRARTPIFSLLGSPECVELLLSRGADMFLCDEDAMSVLHVACIEDRVDALKLFLPRAGHGLDTSIDKDGHTPLRKAIECKSIACAKVLLEAGAIGDVNSKDGLTLVHRAIEMGDSDFLKGCFEHSTFKKGSLTVDGRSVMEFASRKGKFKGRIGELIKEYESFAPQHLAKSRPVTQYTTELERAQATAEYFVLR